MFPEILNLAGGEVVYIHSHDDMNPHGRYTTPYPVAPAGSPASAQSQSEARSWVFVSHAPWYDLRKNGYGLYLFDLVSRRKVLVYDDPEMSEIDPVPVAPRQPPALMPSTVAGGSQSTGRIYCVSVFNSDLPYDHESVKYVRVIAARQQGLTMNANASFRTRLLGEVPLAADGSFYVEVPADTPVRFALLDRDRATVVHETAFTYVRPGQTRGCIGCHESKDTYAPPSFPLAVGASSSPGARQAGRLDLPGYAGHDLQHHRAGLTVRHDTLS